MGFSYWYWAWLGCTILNAAIFIFTTITNLKDFKISIRELVLCLVFICSGPITLAIVLYNGIVSMKKGK